MTRKFMKPLLYLLKAVLVLLVMAAVVFGGFIGWVWWSMYKDERGYDLIKAGKSQADLRAEIDRQTDIKLTESNVVIHAYKTGSFRGSTRWYEISFDPKRSEQMKAMLLEKGYEIGSEFKMKFFIDSLREPPNRDNPKGIAKWWTIARFENTTMFIREQYSRPKSIECFLDEEQGILFIRIRS